MNYMFYVVKRSDGAIVDQENETPYWIANDYESANDLIEKLPRLTGGVQYVVTQCEIDSECCLDDEIMRSD